jgi:hypothetical protein
VLGRGAFLLTLLIAGPASAEIPEAQLVLETLTASTPGLVAEAAPPVFVLLEDGRFFVGGTRSVAGGRLERTDLKDLDNKIARVRKLSGLGASVTLGPGPKKQRLVIRKNPAIVIQGDPASAPANLKPLAALVEDLERFDHESLRPFRPTSYVLRAREGTLPGGCRAWTFSVPLAQALGVGQLVANPGNFPTGAHAASVCDGKNRYVVTLRPLLPGERP